MELQYRSLTAEEVRAWLDFQCEEIFPGDDRSAVESMWTSDTVQDVNGIFIALDEGRIIASAKVCCKAGTLDGAIVRMGSFSGVGTAKAYRGQGIAKKLIAMCFAYMLKQEAHIACLYARPDQVDFYAKLGFLSLPQRKNEGFLRMYRLIAPTHMGDVLLSNTKELIEFLQA